MKGSIGLLILLFYTAGSTLFAQTFKRTVSFAGYFKEAKIDIPENGFEAHDSNRLVIQVLKFYASNVRFLHQGEVVFAEQNSYHLIDIQKQNPVTFFISADSVFEPDAIQFDLGIDSVTNAGGVMGGDLDPAKGMYWAWQSGYINLKLEGQSLLCNTRNHAFEFHLGGYMDADYCLQKVVLPISSNGEINIKLDIAPFLQSIDLTKQNQIMSPGKAAVELSEQIANCFSIMKN